MGLLEQFRAVEGYTFTSGGKELSERNETICRVVDRESPDSDGLEPKFRVRFGDGYETCVYASELKPWYPT